MLETVGVALIHLSIRLGPNGSSVVAIIIFILQAWLDDHWSKEETNSVLDTLRIKRVTRVKPHHYGTLRLNYHQESMLKARKHTVVLHLD